MNTNDFGYIGEDIRKRITDHLASIGPKLTAYMGDGESYTMFGYSSSPIPEDHRLEGRGIKVFYLRLIPCFSAYSQDWDWLVDKLEKEFTRSVFEQVVLSGTLWLEEGGKYRKIPNRNIKILTKNTPVQMHEGVHNIIVEDNPDGGIIIRPNE